MLRTGLLMAAFSMSCLLQAAEPGQDLIEVKLTLPKEVYMRGATDPVAELNVALTLTNRSAKENLNKETVSVTVVGRLTGEERGEIARGLDSGQLKAEDVAAKVAAKKTTENRELWPVNKDSLGYAYVEPQLGPHDVIDFVIQKLPDDGEAQPAKTKAIPRDNKPESAAATDLSPKKYLAAGETSPVYTLPVGRFYLVRDPGRYSIKAILRTIPDSSKPSHFAESNEETFRVLPFKVVDRKIDDVQSNWQEYERGLPSFDYMLYQCKTTAQWDEIYYVQRIAVRKVNKWEWARLCSVKAGTQVQVAQLTPTKVAVVALQHKGDAGCYVLDFTKPGVQVTGDAKPLKDGNPPQLKVEGGKVSFE